METNGVIFTCLETIGVAKTIGPYLVASELRRNNISCQVVDHFDLLSLDNIREIAKKFVSSKTRFIGFSSTFFFNRGSKYFESEYSYLFPHTEKYMSEFFEIFKNINPNIFFVYGGSHVDFLENKNWKNIDLYILGAGEYFLPRFLNENPEVKNPLPKFINCTHLKNNFEETKMRWHQRDIINKGESLPIETSRGCLFKCAFCKHNTFFPYRNKNLDVLKAELEYNYLHFGVKNYMIVDSLFTGNYKPLVKKLSVLINLPFKISFSCFGKLASFMLHPDLREKFLEAGCKHIYFGIESLNNKSLKAVQKTAHVERQLETLYYLKEVWQNEVKMESGFIVGLPYDNEKNINKWVDFLESPQNPLYEYHIQPLNIDSCKNHIFASPLSSNPEKYGYILTGNKHSWKSTTSDMTRLKAQEICNQTYKIKRPFWHLENLLINLGYKEKDLPKINIYEPSFLSKVEELRRQSKDNYLKKLLERKND